MLLRAVRIRRTLCCRSGPPPRLHRGHIPPGHKELWGGGGEWWVEVGGCFKYSMRQQFSSAYYQNRKSLERFHVAKSRWDGLGTVSEGYHFVEDWAIFYSSPLLPSLNLRSRGTGLTPTSAEAGLLACRQKKSGSQTLRNTSEGVFLSF